MANLTRYKQKIFANNSDQVGVFGTGTDKVASKNVETLQSADYEDGWSSAIITSKNYPVWQERDGVDYGFSYQLAYLLQKGIPDWLSTETYYQNDFCKLGNVVYYSLQDSNTNQNPSTETDYWQVFVDLDGKMNVDLSNSTKPYVDTSYSSGSDGYILFSNKDLIQWFRVTNSSNTTLTANLLLTYGNTNYAVSASNVLATAGSTYTAAPLVKSNNKFTFYLSHAANAVDYVDFIVVGRKS